MDLMQFLTYCTLKGLVRYKMEIPSNYDPAAEAHYKIKIADDNYNLDMIYAVVGDTAVVIKSDLSKFYPASHQIIDGNRVSDMVKCFCT